MIIKYYEFRGGLSMNNFEIVSGSVELLDLVQPLWEKLKKHHEINSSYFSDTINGLTFQVRKNKFIKDKTLKVKIDLIKESKNELYIGYCISTINEDLAGEIDSLYVDKEYRKYGLGDKLMNSALEWLDSNQVKTKIIGVAEGNENVLEFYKKYEFYKRSVILQQVKK